MTAPEAVIELVERFHENRADYLSPRYNEVTLRQEFLDPFFEALGWDVYNKHGYAETYKDVIYDENIKVGAASKAPDYTFRAGGKRKFFVEAKKPSERIDGRPDHAYQLKAYAWSASLPVSVLTNFKGLAVYDCRVEPKSTDNADVQRKDYIEYTEYVRRWDDISSVLSRDSVYRGAFDRYCETEKPKTAAMPVGAAFLKQIEAARMLLTENLVERNPRLTAQELNFAVQRTIDRIIFLRICEDRGLEPIGTLRSVVNTHRPYERLCEVFRDADRRYNSGLFHFSSEKNRNEPPDSLTLGLQIEQGPLKKIIVDLYSRPYEFKVIPTEILGQVYEQFLGRVIVLDRAKATVEEKPEVRKAGGVYYTPSYIVDYIVKNTLGKLLEGKTPKDAAKLRILDPACGSGSFLIAAYQYLLNWHRDYYVENAAARKYRKEIYQAAGGLEPQRGSASF